MAGKQPQMRRYIIMAAEGFQDSRLLAPTLQLSGQRIALAARARSISPSSPQMRVLDSIRENGPKLVEMPAEAELSLRLSVPGLKIVPEVFYHRQWERFSVHKRPGPTRGRVARAKVRGLAAKAAKPAAGFEVTVTDRVDGSPIRSVKIVAFTNFAAREGAEATTGANGRALLNGLTANRKLKRVYMYAPAPRFDWRARWAN